MKYMVKVLEVHSVIVEVEAENEQDAQSKAEELITEDELDTVYEYTLSRDEWPVVESI